MLTAEQGPGNMGMLANQVPKASITALRGLICCGCDKCLSKAIAAALSAWPGRCTKLFPSGEHHIILPLTEARDG